MRKILFVMPLLALSFLTNCNKDGYLKTPMHFTCLSDTATLSVFCRAVPEEFNVKLEYSMDKTEWSQVEFEPYNPETETNKSIYSSFNLEKDQKIYFRSDIENIPVSKMEFMGPIPSGTEELKKDGDLAVSGNIMSIYKSTEFEKAEMTKEYCFYGLFSENKNLVDAKDLLLPVKTLTASCYNSMFWNCDALISAPTLPATTLAYRCYKSMFKSCSSLVSIPEELPATTLAEGCYDSMFEYCSSLTKAPFIAGTNVSEDAYSFMFCGCTNLNYVKVAFGTPGSGEWPAANPDDFTQSWLKNVANTGTFVWKGSTEVTRDGDTVPENWTIETY